MTSSSIRNIRNHRDAPAHPRPDAMDHEEVVEVIENLEEGQKIIVWFRPLSQFKCEGGEFTYDGAFELDSNETDHVVNDVPLLARVGYVNMDTHYGEELDEDGEYEQTEFAEINCENIDNEIEMSLTSLDCTGIWSIEVRPDLQGNVEKVQLAEGCHEFRFNYLTKGAAIDGTDIERDELVVLHRELNRFLA